MKRKQMLLALLGSENVVSRQLAYLLITGKETVENAIKEGCGAFMTAVLNDNYDEAMKYAGTADAQALAGKAGSVSIALDSPQQLQRLNFLKIHFNLSDDDVFNVMLKSFYETCVTDMNEERLIKDEGALLVWNVNGKPYTRPGAIAISESVSEVHGTAVAALNENSGISFLGGVHESKDELPAEETKN